MLGSKQKYVRAFMKALEDNGIDRATAAKIKADAERNISEENLPIEYTSGARDIAPGEENPLI